MYGYIFIPIACCEIPVHDTIFLKAQEFRILQAFVPYCLHFAAIFTDLFKRKVEAYILVVLCVNCYTPETPKSIQ